MARPRELRMGQSWPRSVTGRRRVAGRRQWRWPSLAELGSLRNAVRLRGAQVRWAALRLTAFAALVTGCWWVYHSPLLELRSVSVEGTTTLSPQLVEQIAGLDGDRLFTPDFGGARARLLALPGVKDVEISRDLPLGAHITVVERVPWGVWQVGERRYVIDDEGVVLERPASKEAPVIVQLDSRPPLAPGERVDSGAVAVATELVPTAERTVGRKVEGLEFSRAAGLTVTLSGGLRAAFGDVQNYEFKLAALYAVLRQAEQEGRAVHWVDLRFGDLVAVQ